MKLIKTVTTLLITSAIAISMTGCSGDDGEPIKKSTKPAQKKTQKPSPTKKKTNKPKKEIINGYTLPPEPDSKINNATLLGVDSNHNGVRDDVERYIIKKYKNHHKAVTQIGFQLAKAYQKILDNPMNWEENEKVEDAAADCNAYFKSRAKFYGDPILIDHYIFHDIKNLQLNTKSRVKAYLLYDKQLSGKVFSLTKSDKMKQRCSDEVLKLIGGKK